MARHERASGSRPARPRAGRLRPRAYFARARHLRLMNPTWYVSSRRGVALVLQRVNPIFSAEVNIDIAAVTTHLANKGLLTPRLVPTSDGALWVEHDGVWRVLTRIEGICRDALETPAQAGAAGTHRRAVSSRRQRSRPPLPQPPTRRPRHAAPPAHACASCWSSGAATGTSTSSSRWPSACSKPRPRCRRCRRVPIGSCMATRKSRISCSRPTPTGRCASSISTRSRTCRSHSSSATRCAPGAIRPPRTRRARASCDRSSMRQFSATPKQRKAS